MKSLIFSIAVLVFMACGNSVDDPGMPNNKISELELKVDSSAYVEKYDTVFITMLVSHSKIGRINYEVNFRGHFISDIFSIQGYEVIVSNEDSWRHGLVVKYLDKDMSILDTGFTVWDTRNMNLDN